MSSIIAKIGEALSPEITSGAGKLLSSGSTLLQKLGPDGSLLDGLLKGAREKTAQEASPVIDSLTKTFTHDGPEVYDNIHNELQSGNLTSASAITARDKMKGVFDKYVTEGYVKPTRTVSNYYPRDYDQETLAGKSNIAKATQHLIDTGQAANQIEAEGILQRMRSGGTTANHIERRRLADLPDYKTGPQPIFDYIYKGEKTLAERQMFGRYDENLTGALSRIEATQGPEAARNAKWLVEQELGRSVGKGPSTYVGKGVQDWEHGLGTYQALTKLSLSAATQVGQLSNIPVLLRGIGPTVRGLAYTMSHYGDARDMAVKSGSILFQSLQEAKALGATNIKNLVQKVAYGGLSATDQFGRIVATNAGRFAAQDALEALTKNPGDTDSLLTLKLMGIDPKAALLRKSLTPDELLQAGRRASDLSQFHTDSLSVPPLWRSHWAGRTVTMYKQFAFQQTKFIKDMVIKPALNGDMKPLMIASLVFPTMGEVLANFGELIRHGNLKQRPDFDKYPMDHILDNVAHVGGIGLAFDAARLMSYNSRSAFWDFAGGPILSDVIDTATLLSKFDATKPHPLDGMSEDAKQKLLRRVPLIGPRLFEQEFLRNHTRRQGMLEKGTITKISKKLLGN